MNATVTSAARVEQRFADAAAAVFVITQEDLRRSGATSIPEALRMVPGVQVGRIDASKWAVTVRGANGRLANKLLVLVDGRSVYTPSHSGVYWETLDLLLEDIARIEVIRGPGASVWGANAVNGVVNIITARAEETPGGLLSVIVGDEERAILGLRHGGPLGADAHYRVDVKITERDGLRDGWGQDANDDWDLTRGGLRLDWAITPQDSLSLFGDLYDSTLRQNYLIPALAEPDAFRRSNQRGRTSGGSLMARWEHARSLASRFTTQVYLEGFQRDDDFADEERRTVDLDFQHELALTGGRGLVWGFGYRQSRDRFGPAPLIEMQPPRRTLDLGSGFVQGRLPVFDDHGELTLGVKLEYQTLAGWQWQPTLRLLGKPSATTRIWGAISRATRTPARGEHDSTVRFAGAPAGTPAPGLLAMPLPVPALVLLTGNDDFKAEDLWSFELGGRAWAGKGLFVDLALFYHAQDNLRVYLPSGGPRVQDGVPVLVGDIANGERASIRGAELAVDWRPLPRVHTQLAYTYLHSRYEQKAVARRSPVLNLPPAEGRDPHHVLSLRSGLDLPGAVHLDLWLRYVGQVAAITDATTPTNSVGLDAYTTLDARVAWRPHAEVELSLVGQNLIGAPRVEFVNEIGSFPTQVERSLYAQLRWDF